MMLVGLADTFIISYAGEAAVSGVSLFNSFNTVLYLFTTLASDGAVIVSQYIGNGKQETAFESISQLLIISAVFSVIITAVVCMLNQDIISVVFGKNEPEDCK